MNKIKMCGYRLLKNKSAWIVFCLTILITISNALDKDMGDTIYERFVVSINNGNWTLMFVVVGGCLVNSFIKNGYIKNLVGIISSKNMSYVFAVTITLYISVVALINLVLAMGCKFLGFTEVENGMGMEEILFIIFSIMQICMISFMVILIALFTQNVVIAIVFGLIWSAYFQDVVVMQIKSITNYYQIIEIVGLLSICIFSNYLLTKKREAYGC